MDIAAESGRLFELRRICPAGRDDNPVLPGFGQGIRPPKKLDLHGNRCPGNIGAVPGRFRNFANRRTLDSSMNEIAKQKAADWDRGRSQMVPGGSSPLIEER
jgi:hypothetical protein